MSERRFMLYDRQPPLIPPDVLIEAMGTALNETVIASFMKQSSQWPTGPLKLSPWYVRYWRRIDRYLPRVSVHIGPRPCYRECCDE